MIDEIIKIMNDLGLEPVSVRIPNEPTDIDIDKVYLINNSERTAYNRIRDIANKCDQNLRWEIVAKCLHNDICVISELIKDNDIKYPNKLQEFLENCNIVKKCLDYKYNIKYQYIQDFVDNTKIEKSIDDMDADELREYIRTHYNK